MNREQQAVKLVSDLANLIVGNPDKLKCEDRQFGQSTTLILEAAASDTGRLVGSRGAMIAALKQIGNDIALNGFELLVNEPKQTAPVVPFKPWAAQPVKDALVSIVQTAFNGHASVDWQTAGNAELVEIEVASGFDSDMIERMDANLSLVFHSIGRAHGRNLQLRVREAVRR